MFINVVALFITLRGQGDRCALTLRFIGRCYDFVTKTYNLPVTYIYKMYVTEADIQQHLESISNDKCFVPLSLD